MPGFERYIGIDYSGAETADSSLRGLRVYVAADQETPPREIGPPPSPRKYWTRRGVAEWLFERLSEETQTLVGIDHGFSFPLQYFNRYDLPVNWNGFLEDFVSHWPTDKYKVDSVRDGTCGNGAARTGRPRWRRLAEVRAGAKSVFHFDVPGSVAKSTHAGLPWLRYLRSKDAGKIHFWPFDGWEIPSSRSVAAEVYPALWSRSFAREDRNSDQHDAYSIAAWMRQTDRCGNLRNFFNPDLTEEDRRTAEIEGWILGIP